jgi:hypothetical protein
MDSGGTAANGGKTTGAKTLCGDGAAQHGHIVTCRYCSAIGNGKLFSFATCNSCKLLPSSGSTLSSTPDLPMLTKISAATLIPSIFHVKKTIPFQTTTNYSMIPMQKKQDIPE